MFIRDASGKIKGITDIAKMIGAVCTVIAMLFGGYMFLNGQMTAIAQDIESQTVKTFQMEQKVIDLKYDVIRLEALRDNLDDLNTDRVILIKQLEMNPDSEILKQELEDNEEKIERRKDQIEKLENKLDE